MAGIVAQITKANAIRIERRKKYLPSDKCVYFIPPFDPSFQKEKHNPFCKRRIEYEFRHKADVDTDEIREIIEELAKQTEEELNQYDSKATQLVKALIALVFLGFWTFLLIFLYLTVTGIQFTSEEKV